MALFFSVEEPTPSLRPLLSPTLYAEANTAVDPLKSQKRFTPYYVTSIFILKGEERVHTSHMLPFSLVWRYQTGRQILRERQLPQFSRMKAIKKSTADAKLIQTGPTDRNRSQVILWMSMDWVGECGSSCRLSPICSDSFQTFLPRCPTWPCMCFSGWVFGYLKLFHFVFHDLSLILDRARSHDEYGYPQPSYLVTCFLMITGFVITFEPSSYKNYQRKFYNWLLSFLRLGLIRSRLLILLGNTFTSGLRSCALDLTKKNFGRTLWGCSDTMVMICGLRDFSRAATYEGIC